MMSKVLKFWHSLFPRPAEQPEHPQPETADTPARRHPPAIVVRTALRQKQKMLKASP